MGDLFDAARLALGLLVRLDAGLVAIVSLSLVVSLSAVVIAGLIGLPAGAALAMYRFPGKRAVILIGNALLGLPPVVVGLVAYILLSRSGPLGQLGLLFTPTAMVIVQAVLAVPIVLVIVHRAVDALWRRYGDELLIIASSRVRVIPHMLALGRAQVLTALLAGFGRTISEVGAIVLVGGNIAGSTRTMTTSIMLETSKGNLPLALALGMVLIIISFGVNAVAFAIGERKQP